MTEHSAPWWKTGVIYQIYPRSFQDSDGDGVGDLAGIMARLDYLQWLGVDALWLSPIYSSPMLDFGYDVSDFTAVDPLFGTLDDFDRLLDAAHARGLKVVMDFVPNHTSDQHAWFIESRSARNSPKRDWYIWADPTPDGDPPNNWLSYFGGAAWTLDKKTGQYYMHNFLAAQPELNYRNPDVRAAVFDSLRFWLDRGVDGFRLDVIDRLTKDPDLRDNPPNPDYVQGRDNPMSALLRAYSQNTPGIMDVIREFQGVFKAYGDERVSIGEIDYYSDPADQVVFFGEQAGEGLDLPFNFGLLLLHWSAKAVRDFVNAYDAAIPAHGWPNYVLGNHDQHRLASRIGAAQTGMAAMLLLTLRGTPFIYNGDELGMENVTIPQHLVQDPQGVNLPGFTRDVARTPMQWSAEANAGFTTGTPWLPLADDYTTRNVDALRAAPDSILNLYHRLLALRRETPALTLGRYFALDYTPDDCFAYIRQHDEARVLVALNFSHEPRTVVVTGIEREGTVALSTRLDREGERVELDKITLRPDEGLLIAL
jgi:alpha-glucosidase